MDDRLKLDRKAFGKTGQAISEVGMGTYYDPFWLATAYFGWRRGGRAKVEALREGLNGGITLIDTAEIYGSEPLVAEAIEGYKREDFFIATKVWSSHLRREALERAFERSLRRLRLSYVDLYQVHWPNPRVPIAETMGTMESLVEKGKARHIGVSNFSLRQLVEANEALKRSQIVSNQVDYSLANRSIERELLPYCEKNDVAILAYFPLGHGKLATDRTRFDRLSKSYSKIPSQIALNWLTSKRNVFPIPRASRRSHVAENLGASGWSMTDADREDLEKAFPA